jgi:hypothetical protein
MIGKQRVRSGGPNGVDAVPLLLALAEGCAFL